MNLQELSRALISSVSRRDLNEACEHLRRFHDSGGEQFHAYELLCDLTRSEKDEDARDMFLDLSDFAYGWCGPPADIWGRSLRDRVFLYRVTAVEAYRDDLCALLPGVSQAHIEEYHLAWMEQGTMIEFKFTNGEITQAPLATYFVSVPTELTKDFDLSNAPVVLCVSASTHVTPGTELWVNRPSNVGNS